MTPPGPRRAVAFTLIEMLVVITIIAVLAGLAFPVFQSVQNSAKKTSAKNDAVQVVTAVDAFYTEYGRYPVTANSGDDANDFFAGDDPENNGLMDILRAHPTSSAAAATNPRMIAFFQPRIATDSNKPTSGIGGDGRLYDPWNNCYRIRVDSNYNNLLTNPYTSGAGSADIGAGVIVWSIGKDKAGATDKQNGGDKTSGVAKDDVVSWQ